MRRALLLVLTMSLLLAGCGAAKRDEKLTKERLARLGEAQELSFSAAVTARTGTEEFRYTADVLRRDGETAVTLTEPALLAGVRLRSADGGETLEYDGAALYLGGTLSEGRLSPAGALPLLERTLSEGRLARCRRSGGCLVAELALDDELGATVWLLPPEWTPSRAELTPAEGAVITMELTDWKEG